MTFIVENPLRQNRMLNARQAFEQGFADALLEPVEFLDESLAFLVAKIEEGSGKREPDADLSRRRRGRAQGALAARRPGSRRHARALPRARPDRRRRHVVARGGLPRRGGRARRAPPGPGRRRRPSTRSTSSSAGRSAESASRTSSRVACRRSASSAPGLMARQLALLFLRRLEVPVVLRDLTQEQVDDAVELDPRRARRARARRGASARARPASSARSSPEARASTSSPAATSSSRPCSRSWT